MKKKTSTYTNITPHFTMEEFYVSATARTRGIDNTPNEAVKQNIINLAANILEPIRHQYKQVIIITSGYRCPELNKAVGGSKTSQHLQGEAADIHTLTDTPQANRRLFDLIVSMIEEGKITVGQLIDEKSYNWIHISLPTPKHKNEILHIK